MSAVAAGRFNGVVPGVGALLSGAIAVNVYEVGTTTAVDLYTDDASGDAAPNPTSTDILGNYSFFAAAGDVDVEYQLGTVTNRVTVTVRPSPDGTAVIPLSPEAFTLTYSTAAETVEDATVAAVPTTGSTVTTPYGYTTQAQADDIPVAINALTADVLALRKVVVALVNALAAAGIVTT